MKQTQLIFISFVLLLASTCYAIDAAKDGPIYGDPEGLKRVEKLEQQLHNMEIIQAHPRIFINPQTVDLYRDRLRPYNFYPLENVRVLADKGDIVNLAFMWLMYEKDKPEIAQQYARVAINALIQKNPLTGDKRFIDQEVARMALAFDWLYNAMTEEERGLLVNKLSGLANIDQRAQSIRKGNKVAGETFHREEWSFNSYQAWPEIALAHHNPNADLVYKSRWNYNWYWGDAARMCAYAADGTPFEGYYYGADGVEWFLPLRSATGINLIDGEFGWCKNAAYHVLYRLDLERGREILHHGVALGAAGCVSYVDGTVAWKIKGWLGRTLALAYDNAYVKWVTENKIPISDWILTTVNYGGMDDLISIANILFKEPAISGLDLSKATYADLPYAKLFPGGNEAYMRTGWFGRPTVIGFRSSPAYTKTSHGDFDVNTFVIYKDGVLSPDSGIYDAYSGQDNYFRYQKTTVAHNNILIIDPLKPDEPKKLGVRAPDPGGVDNVFTRTFGAPSQFGNEDVFLHNPYADWTRIAAFKTTPAYDYVVGEGAKAYRERLEKYYRTLVFIRKGNKGYLIVYDQLELKNSAFQIKGRLYQIKWLLHLVTEPVINGKKIKTEVPGRIEFYKGNFLNAKNVFGTSNIFLKILKPNNYLIRKIGGEGYEFWVDGFKPQNHPVAKKDIQRIEEQMGGKWQECGTWRIEIIPHDKKDAYTFINVFYIGDGNEVFDPATINLKEDGTNYTITIQDDIVPASVTFIKGERPSGSIIIKDKAGGVLAEDKFPEVSIRQ